MKQLFLMVVFLLALIPVYAQFSIYFERGAAFSGYNNARIPGSGDSDRFSLTSDLKSEVAPALRVNMFYKFHPRHQLSLLYAPLTIEANGSFDRDIRFMGTTFEADEAVDGTYRFDSYRIQYRYIFENQKQILRSIGLTLKVRDAEIALRSSSGKAGKTNTGAVPLVNFQLAYELNPSFLLSIDGEALASPYGRAEDILLSMNYKLNDRYTLNAGYRLLEGGSDNDEVYTFAMINYAVLGIRVQF